jgi:hypothetical protein
MGGERHPGPASLAGLSWLARGGCVAGRDGMEHQRRQVPCEEA